MFKYFTCLSACCLSALIGCTALSVAVAQQIDDSGSRPSAMDADTRMLSAAEIEDVAEFVNSILAIHPDIRAAEASRDAAGARKRQANRPIYNPEFGADYEDAVDETYEIGLFQTVDWAGKKKAASAVESSASLSADAMYLQTRNETAAAIFRQLSDYWTKLQLLQLASTSSSLLHDFAQQAGMRYQAGDMMRVEYETAQLTYAEVKMRKAEIEADLASAANALMAFGAPVNTNSWPKMPMRIPETALGLRQVNSVLETLPQVNAARATADAAAANVELAKSMKKPDPTFGIRVGEEDSESLVGVSFSIPLYVRNNFDENVMAALGEKSKAEAEADGVERRARARLIVAIQRFTTMRTAWSEWEDVSSLSLDTQTNLLTKLWEARELNMSEFLLQFRQTLATQKTAVELRQTIWDAWIDYLEESNQVETWFKPYAFGLDTHTEVTSPRIDQ